MCDTVEYFYRPKSMLVKTQALLVISSDVNCVATEAKPRFSVRSFGYALFVVLKGEQTMEEQNKTILDQESEIEKPEETKKEIPKKTIIIGTIIAVVAIIAIVCIILLGGKNAPIGSTPSGDDPSTENHTSYDAFNFYPQDDGTYIVAVGNGKYLSEIVIPSTYNGGKVVGIAENGFKDCENLQSIIIPNGITDIGDYAFKNCTSLVTINIPDSVTSIGNEAFYECSSIVEINLPSKLTDLGELSFYNCISLKSI